MASEAAAAHARSLYRSLLRELPVRTPRSAPSPLRTSIHSHFAPSASASSGASEDYLLARRQELEQGIQYLKAQRVYGALLERYNPNANLDDEERIRLTARRVGMEMPVEWYATGKGKPGEYGIKFDGIKKGEKDD